MAESPVIIKKYGNRRLYDTEASSYITLEDLARMIKAGRDVKVVDAKSNQDLTKSVLLQIISEQEKDQDLIPVSFLKKMIQIGDASLRDALQRYLALSLETFVAAQRDLEQKYRNLTGGLLNPLLWLMPPLAQASTAAPGPAGPAAAPASAPTPAEPEPATAPDARAARSKGSKEPDPSTAQQLRALKDQVAQIQKLLAKLEK